MTHIVDLPHDEQILALAAFTALANDQRGYPEQCGGGGCSLLSPVLHAAGMWAWMSEHVGDLTHRMTTRGSHSWHYGEDNVREKVEKSLRKLRSSYGFGREVEENIKSNYRYRVEQKGHRGSFEDFYAQFGRAALEYSRAHAQLTVYNAAQFHARQAAIEVGKLNYGGAEIHLAELEQMLNDGWTQYADLVSIQNGVVMPFDGTITESRTIATVRFLESLTRYEFEPDAEKLLISKVAMRHPEIVEEIEGMRSRSPVLERILNSALFRL